MVTDNGAGPGDGIRIELILRLWKEGMSVADIVRITGETPADVYRLLKAGQKAEVAKADQDDFEG